jgi:hypothetical protein
VVKVDSGVHCVDSFPLVLVVLMVLVLVVLVALVLVLELVLLVGRRRIPNLFPILRQNLLALVQRSGEGASRLQPRQLKAFKNNKIK